MAAVVSRRPETPAARPSREERAAQRMAARIRESDRLAQEHQATLDPRQRADLDPPDHHL